MTANKDGLILIGSNLDMMIEKVIPMMVDGVTVLEVHETGSVVLSDKYLSDMVKILSGNIHVKVNEKKVATLQSGEIITRPYKKVNTWTFLDSFS